MDTEEDMPRPDELQDGTLAEVNALRDLLSQIGDPDAAHDAGVIDAMDYAIFQNYGYKGLYGGLGQREIHAKKGLKKSQKILDHMGHEELAANLFRATQTEAKLRREGIQGKSQANQTHFGVGREVRETIKRLSGTMPEDLPTPEKSIKQLEREERKRLEEKDRDKEER